MGGDPNAKSSSSSKKELASCVDMPKSLKRLEAVVVVVVVVMVVVVTGRGGGTDVRQGFFADAKGFGGGAIGLFALD